MARGTGSGGARRRSPWRWVGWGAAALVLLVPWVAMRFTDEVDWDVADFLFAGALLLGVGVPFELAVRKSGDAAYRAGVGVALVAAFLLLWVNGAVGIIGSEHNDANAMYGGVLAVGALGAALARFRPRGMARALFATALAQALVGGIALALGLGAPENGPREIVGLNGFFVALFAGSAVLLRKASQRRPEAGFGPDDRPFVPGAPRSGS